MTIKGTNKLTADVDLKQPGPWLGIRHLVLCLCFLGQFSAYTMRVNISIAMVAMVDNSENPDFEQFDWDSFTQNMIFSAFDWSYAVMLIPSGLLSQTYGGKWPYLIGVAVTSIAAILTPVSASAGGWGAVCALRVITGIAQSPSAPGVQFVVAKWAPFNERATFMSVVYAGVPIAHMVGFSLGGYLAVSGGGWPSIFYAFGGFGLGWCVLWSLLVTDCPGDHALISSDERDHIESSVPPSNKVAFRNTPWMTLIKSKPVWGLVFASFAYMWGSHILMSQLPTYIKTVLNFTIGNSGLYSALPYALMAILTPLFGVISDALIKRKWLTITVSRKVFNTVSSLGPAIALAGLGYVNPGEAGLAVGLLVISVGVSGSVALGFLVNTIDLSPKHSSILMGIAIGLGDIMGIAAPLVVGAVVTDKGSTDQWRIVFWISAAIYIVGNAMYVWLGDANKQAWDDMKENDPENRER